MAPQTPQPAAQASTADFPLRSHTAAGGAADAAARFAGLADVAAVDARLRRLVKPTTPSSTDCCMSGCARCVWDLYEDDMAAFNADRRGLRARRRQLLGEPVDADADSDEPAAEMDAGMRALRDMERAIKAKEEAAAAAAAAARQA